MIILASAVYKQRLLISQFREVAYLELSECIERYAVYIYVTHETSHLLCLEEKDG